jgi:hypothetical protein
MTDLITPRDIIDIPVGGPGDPLNSPNHIDSHRIAKNELQALSDRTEPALRNISGLAPPGGPGIQTYTDQSGEVWLGLNGGPWRRARDVLNVKYTRTAGFTLPATPNTPALLPWDTLIYDPFTVYNTATGLLTCPVPGIYLVRHSASFPSPPEGGSLTLMVYRTGVMFEITGANVGQQTTVIVQGVHFVDCAAGDTLATWLQSNLAGLGLRLTVVETTLAVTWLSPSPAVLVP